MSEQTANLCTTDACESLRARLAKYEDAEGRPVRAKVRMPPRMYDEPDAESPEFARGHNAALEYVARLNSAPVSAGGVDERAAFEAAYLKANYPRVHSGELSAPPIFVKTKAGEYDDPDMQRTWIMWQARAALTASASNHGEQVRKGWRLVPFEPNEAIRDAINLLCDDHSAFEDSDAFWSYLLAATPSAGSQEQE